MFRGMHRLGARGNVWSMQMPWEDIIRSLLQARSGPTDALPHDEYILANMVRFHIRVANVGAAVHLRCAKLRTWVVLALMKDLIDRHPVFDKWQDRDARYAAMQRSVESKYPWAYDNKGGNLYPKEDGEVPPAVQEALDANARAQDPESTLIFEKECGSRRRGEGCGRRLRRHPPEGLRRRTE